VIAGTREFCAFSPGLAVADLSANYWLRQVMLRLRREICWMWQERTGASSTRVTPPPIDRLSESLDRARYWEDKQRFWVSDVTARYLTAQITAGPPHCIGSPARGSFGWVVGQAELDPVATFLLSLGLMASFDSASGAVIAACHNDAHRTSPTLALAQKLWDAPEEVLALADPLHTLFRLGLLRRADTVPAGTEWDAPLHTPELIARRLLFPDAPHPPQLTTVVRNNRRSAALTERARLTALRLRMDTSEIRIVPLLTAQGASIGEVMAAIAEISGRRIVQLRGPVSAQSIVVALVLCWLDGCDLLLRLGAVPGQVKLAETLLPCAALPVTVFAEATDRGPLDGIPQYLLFGGIEVPPLSYAQRVECWSEALGPVAESVSSAVAETARRFRYEAETIDRIASALRSVPEPITPQAITTECRSAARLELGDLAQSVNPRFDKASELFLPARQFDQFREVLQAMRTLTDVHYRWGTARVWNEGGISVLFAGPPGTGKTMAAEILASELNLPMYRIDLSQVVNKYIGETEKNLKRIFDAADLSDALLLFDEADSIFGKRMEARDAHDRYANLEISYLLDRMERFKGLAVLATNRKKDLDEAFLRRLRYVIDFPLPGLLQRRCIWEQSIPVGVDASQVDLAFLASRFPIAGGHIRSVIFNACLQSAGGSGRPALRMEEVLVALKRELDKINRPVGLDLFGNYAPLIRSTEREADDNSD
jgi:hypothetical protein